MTTVSFRTVNGTIYKLNVTPDTTVAQAKEILAEEHDLDLPSIKLILSATILKDDQVFSQLSLKPNQFIVIHTKKRPARPAAPVQPPVQPPVQQPVQPPVQQPVQPPIQQPVQPPVQPQVQSPPETKPSGNQDPPNFAELVANLVDIGFEKSQCEQALRIANYNPDTAAMILLSGDVPAAPSNPISHPPPPPSRPQQDTGNGQLSQLLSQLTPDEQSTVQNLCESLGFDMETVVQVFLACDKNESMTQDCLSGMA